MGRRKSVRCARKSDRENIVLIQVRERKVWIQDAWDADEDAYLQEADVDKKARHVEGHREEILKRMQEKRYESSWSLCFTEMVNCHSRGANL